MPQGRRKVPFSQKQKKIQLQAKREKRREFIKSASFDHDHSQNRFGEEVNGNPEVHTRHDDHRTTDLHSKMTGANSIKSVSSESSSDESTGSIDTEADKPSENVNRGGGDDGIKVLPSLQELKVAKLNQQPMKGQNQKKQFNCFSTGVIEEKGGGYDPNKYRLHFAKESKEEIDSRKLAAQQMHLRVLPKESLELNIDEVFGTEESNAMEMPKRPNWSYKMDRLQLELNEEKYFRNYLAHLHSNNASQISLDRLSYFELNLETWRQLWRVLELSDILLLIADIRHPVLHFPPSLYRHITEDLKKPVVLLLNKIDLAPPEVCVAWKQYLQDKFPLLEIVLYATDSKNFSLESDDSKPQVNLNALDVRKVKIGRKKPTRSSYKAPIGLKELLKACEKCCPRKKFDFAAWNYKVGKQLSGDFEYTETSICEVSQALTIGCIGHPNVGKSSVINSIVGRKVVSTSRTPGHTKHFQTYFVTCNIQLCDCPGLVFPSIVDKQQQIFSGLYPIAQVREPYTAVGYVSERLPLIDMLQLKHPNDANDAWTAWDVCEAWAIKRGYRVAKTSRYDVYRAANHLLRLTVEGKICMLTYPPDFFSKREFWLNQNDTVDLKKYITTIVKMVETENQAEKSRSLASVYEIYDEEGSADGNSDRSSTNEQQQHSNSKTDGNPSGVSNKFSQLEFSD